MKMMRMSSDLGYKTFYFTYSISIFRQPQEVNFVISDDME